MIDNSKVKISIIIPCYNTNQVYFKKCLESILSQSLCEFEIIIVDDGSSEEYRKFYSKLTDYRIKIIYQDNKGVSSARNTGVKQTCGQYILFVDADDALTENALAEAYKTAQNYNADVVFGCNIHMNEYNGSYNVALLTNQIYIYKDNDIDKLRPIMVGKHLRYGDGKIYIGRGPWNRLIRRELLTEICFNTDLVILEDVLWNLQILKQCKTVCCVGKAWYLYNTETGEATKKFRPNAVKENENGLQVIRPELDFKNDMEFKAYYDRCFEDMFRICNNAYHSDKYEFNKTKKIFYHNKPWNEVTNIRYWKLSDLKTKIKIVMFKFRVLYDISEKKQHVKI